MNVPHDLQNIQTLMRTQKVQGYSSFLTSETMQQLKHTDLLQGLAGQVRLCHCKSVALCGEVSHLAVGGPVM